MFVCPTNEEKLAVQKAAQAGQPTRVPLNWSHNSRIVVLNRELNPEGHTYAQMLDDPQVCMTVQSRWQEYTGEVLNQTCDQPVGLPEEWTLSVEWHNTYDGQYFGGRLELRDDQVPDVQPAYGLDDVDDLLKQDFSRPLENPFIVDTMRRRERLLKAAETFEYRGRKGKVAHFVVGFDGPLTVAAMLFGSDIFTLLALDPPKARELLLFLTRAAVLRTRALRKIAGLEEKVDGWWWLADDSIQLISGQMVREVVLPAHELWFREMSDTTPQTRNRFIHLCGDATRHFKMLRDELGIYAFDTGFPVDHGALRRELGPEVHIAGGPEVALLRNGTPEQCYQRTKDILQSGIMEGGKFALREGNNLPPCCPLENLEAVYQADLDHGWYE